MLCLHIGIRVCVFVCVIQGRRKGGAGGAGAPPIQRGVLSTPNILINRYIVIRNLLNRCKNVLF